MHEKIFKQVETLARSIQADLRKKGFVVPTDNGDGTISVDNYTIIKQKTGFYVIKDSTNEVVVDKINLPQSAALLANSLALGRWIDDTILREDRHYGYSVFEESVAKRSIEHNLKIKDYNKIDLMNVKLVDAIHKKNRSMKVILNSFEKLRRLR